jgi:4-amino-4-deoxychorismate lyase
MTLALVNGVAVANAGAAVALDDRGLQYGDGLFETTLLRNGEVRFWSDHLARLADGCKRLGLPGPSVEALAADVAKITAGQSDGVIKLIVTRGRGGRGYGVDAKASSTRIVTWHPEPAAAKSIRARWCTTRLGRNPALAGIKHLNRLEQVLARVEWNDAAIDEGLMLDTEGELICATSANVFIVNEGALYTPDLRFCGIRGVMRSKVIEAAANAGIVTHEEPLWPEDIDTASEVFLTNAVRGIRSIERIDDREWNSAPVASLLSHALGLS